MPAAAIARLAPMIAALACSRSWQVSMIRPCAPPAISPAALRSYASRSSAKGTWPRVGSLVPGPIEPRTQRGRSGVDSSAATSLAIRAPASDSSSIRSVMSYSPRLARLAPKVLVSTQSSPPRSTPRAPPGRCPGRVTLRTSLQPSWPSKSSSVGRGRLEHRPHAPIGHDDTIAEGLTQCLLESRSWLTSLSRGPPKASPCSTHHVGDGRVTERSGDRCHVTHALRNQ